MVTLTEAIKPYKHSDIVLTIGKRGKYKDYDIEIKYELTDIDGIRIEVVHVTMKSLKEECVYSLNPRDLYYCAQEQKEWFFLGKFNGEFGKFTISYGELCYINQLAKIAQQELKHMITAYDNINATVNIMYENLLTTEKS